MEDLTALLLALPITIEDVRAHIDSGDVPPHEAAKLVTLAEAALGHLCDHARSVGGL